MQIKMIVKLAVIEYLSKSHQMCEMVNEREVEMRKLAERIDHILEEREKAVERGDIGTIFSIDQVLPILEEKLNEDRQNETGIHPYWSQHEVGPAELCLTADPESRWLTLEEEDHEIMGYFWFEDQISRESYGRNPHWQEVKWQHESLKEEILQEIRELWMKFIATRRKAAGNERAMGQVKNRFEFALRKIRSRIMKEGYAWTQLRSCKVVRHDNRLCILDKVWAPGLSKETLKKLQGPPKPRPVYGMGLSYAAKTECLEAIWACAQKGLHLGNSGRKNGPWAIWEPKAEHNRSGAEMWDGAPFPVNSTDVKAWDAYLKDEVETERKEFLLFSDYARKDEAEEEYEEQPERWESDLELEENLTYHCEQDELFGLYGDLNLDRPIQWYWAD